MKNTFVLLLSCFFTFSAFASGDHGEAAEGAAGRFGPGKAVEAFDKEQGFKLSEKAAKSLGIQFGPLSGAGPWQLPKGSLVQIKQSVGVYRKYDGWISLVLVKVVKEERGTVYIRSEDLEPGDEVAVGGSRYLRMTDSDLNAGTVDSCAH